MELFGLGAPELLLILFVLLLFFGKDKLPDLARSIGSSFRELKKGFSESATEEAEVDKKRSTGATKKS
jgi:TatA/E family protein of Tat protein translocase